MFKTDKEIAKAKFKEGEEALKVKNHKFAIELFNAAIENNPDFAEAYNNLGRAYEFSGEFENAMGAYQKATELKPDYAIAHNNQAWILMKQHDDYKGALSKADAAISADPNLMCAHFTRAYALDNLKQYEEAIVAINRTIELTPEGDDWIAEWYATRGVIAMHWHKQEASEERRQEAIADFELAIKNRPENPLPFMHNLEKVEDYLLEMSPPSPALKR